MADADIIRALQDGFTGLHARLDQFSEKQSAHTTRITLLENKLPQQPCGYLQRHLEGHPKGHEVQALVDGAKDMRRGVKDVIFDMMKGAAKIAIALLAGAFGYKLFGNQ